MRGLTPNHYPQIINELTNSLKIMDWILGADQNKKPEKTKNKTVKKHKTKQNNSIKTTHLL